jgi:hypothetical protein
VCVYTYHTVFSFSRDHSTPCFVVYVSGQCSSAYTSLSDFTCMRHSFTLVGCLRGELFIYTVYDETGQIFYHKNNSKLSNLYTKDSYYESINLCPVLYKSPCYFHNVSLASGRHNYPHFADEKPEVLRINTFA